MIGELAGLLRNRGFEWEIYWEKGRSDSFSIERESVERAQRSFFSGVGLRIGINGRTGFSYVTGLNHRREELESLVKRAVKLAKVGEMPFKGFPEVRKPARVKGLYDRRIAEMPFEEAYSLANGLSERMRELKGRNQTLSGGLGLSVVHRGVVNSNGIELSSWETLLAFSSYAVEMNGGSGSGYEWNSYRDLGALKEADAIVKRSVELAGDSYRGEETKPYEGELLLCPEAFGSVLSILLENLRGDVVYHGNSRFSEPGEIVGSDLVTILDDATLPGAPGSYPFDGEGVPGQRTGLVTGGKLKSLLLDHTYASLLGMESTGNGLRTFRDTPVIGTSNIEVLPGKDDIEGFDGVAVCRLFGEHTANPVSGDFSLPVELAYGRGVGGDPMKGGMFVGNVFELLKGIKGIGKRTVRKGSFKAPPVLVEGRLL